MERIKQEEKTRTQEWSLWDKRHRRSSRDGSDEQAWEASEFQLTIGKRKLIVNIREMTPEERTRLESIDTILRSETVRGQIRPIIERVRGELAREKAALMTWEPIPLTVFGRALPREIRSAWVFVLRAGADTGAERHPNSHQRMMTFEGSGDMQTEERGRWESNILVSNREAPLEQRWISIPQNVWHRPVVGANADWTVVSFHTVLAEELIEEKLDDSSQDGTKQKKYLDRK
jgi:hypothetical protein